MTSPRTASAQRRTQPRATRRTADAAPTPLPDASNGHRFSRTMWLAGLLRQRVLSGEYKPGERIREAQLRTETGFSNGPIREALQAIVADGLAERAPWHGVRVKALSERQIFELFQVRLALVEYAAELAARNRSPSVRETAKVLKRSMEEGFSKVDNAGHPSFNGLLSQWLLASAGNEVLRSIWDKTMMQTLVYVNASIRKSRGSRNRALINELIDRICDGEVRAARSVARELTRQTLTDLGIKGTL
jgi:DNA-binding GntR family transcriptional regulator